MTEPFTGQFIAGRRASGGTRTFQASDAATGELLAPRFEEASAEAIDEACATAGRAAPAYRAMPLAARAAFIETIADELDALAETFVERTPRETGLPEARIRGELGRTTGQLRLFADVVRAGDFLGVRIDEGDPGRSPAPKPDLRQYQVPLGPVAVFGASNFPLAFSVAGGDTASALAAGCPVVVKGHPGHPATSALAAQAIEAAVERCDVVPGVFSLVQGASNDVGAALVQHPAIKAVGFTGSQRGGLALEKLAQARPEPIPVYAEMGSVNPLFLLPGALEERADALAEGFVGSLTLGSGQFCTNPGIVFAPAGAALDAWLDKVAARLGQVDPAVMLHPGILAAYQQNVARLANADGVRAVAEGGEAEGRAQARVFRTTLDHFHADPALAEEVFGPCALVVEVDSPRQLETAAAGLVGQLTATVHAMPSELAERRSLVSALEGKAGRVVFNGFPTGVEVGHAMVHGGPYPATTNARMTSVGTLAIERFLRPVSYQDFPREALPEALRDGNPLGLRRRVNGRMENM